LLLGCVAAFGQPPDVHHHNIDVGIGPGIPTGSTSDFLGAAPLVGFHYGFRFNKLFQADAGFQLAWNAAGNNQNPVFTNVGEIRGGDREYMFPLGGRIIIPQPWNRIEIAAGGGGVYLHYSEVAPTGGAVGVQCYSCTSRGGWGGYGLGNVSYFLDENHNFRVGATAQYISAGTNGDAVGNVPGFHTTDHWFNLMFGVGISF
jgi:hypothetical protein